jgi:NitT/TauT family transport system permease protein
LSFYGTISYASHIFLGDIFTRQGVPIFYPLSNKKISFGNLRVGTSISNLVEILIVLILLWELLSKYNIIDSFIFSRPSKIIKLLYKYISTNEIFKHIYISSIETILGLIIGTIFGIIVAFIMWYYKFLARILEPYLIILNALPKTALAPIIIILFGTNMKGIVVVSISLSLIITIISAYNHFINVDFNKIKMLKSFNANKIQIFKYLILPINRYNIFNIIKINIGMSFIGVIVGEFIVSRKGIGYLINYGSQVFNMDLVYMGVLVLCILTIFIYIILKLIEKTFNFNQRENE